MNPIDNPQTVALSSNRHAESITCAIDLLPHARQAVVNQSIPRRCVLQAGLAAGVSLLVPPAQACEFVASTLTIIHPWTRATGEGATSAIVCMTFQDVSQADCLIGAQTPVAEGVELGGEGVGPLVNFAILEGQTSVLSERGPHLRLVGLKFPMQVGRQYPLTLTFAKAGSILATLSVDYTRFG